ncbi:hypothetical protein GUITHDRAFT_117427 [Guillardia theta CCMP2712]|uniref:Uncharacterized protein n=1 Tax=Guillardia theta (strain CCMP2712) TaxID=905079 RepID=L1IKI0_GUITC|nr:hypothetical protein GUITHDRAFT_117427 [Guillardia theta CCMP2712]EKX36429.1 hypothetical protein GUITHDRAFT_117427 [Guillardia theta CCMP2712]|eukprot:XP_005823409.1 hypothetical protein GUITHDRAFT_117427 [Guillardia theta CCMP2712]
MGTINAKERQKGEEEVAMASRGKKGLKSGMFLGGQVGSSASRMEDSAWDLVGCCLQRNAHQRILASTHTNKQVESPFGVVPTFEQISVPRSSAHMASMRRGSYSGKEISGAPQNFTSFRRLSEIKLETKKDADPNGKLTFSPKGLLKQKQGFVHFNEESMSKSFRQNQNVSALHNLW